MLQQVNFFRGSARKSLEGGGLKLERNAMREDWGKEITRKKKAFEPH